MIILFDLPRLQGRRGGQRCEAAILIARYFCRMMRRIFRIAIECVRRAMPDSETGTNAGAHHSAEAQTHRGATRGLVKCSPTTPIPSSAQPLTYNTEMRISGQEVD